MAAATCRRPYGSGLRWVISVEAVLHHSDQVLLALSDRNEWSCPGAARSRETLEECVERAVLEETSLRVRGDRVVRSWVYEVVPAVSVVIIAYGCTLASPRPMPTASANHKQVAFIPIHRLDNLMFPQGYRDALTAWLPT
jgi:ADP-ribose pyrophosphatase YjhB (NUDIX family)